VTVELVGLLELMNVTDLTKLANLAELAKLTEMGPNLQKSLNSQKKTKLREKFKPTEKRIPAPQPTPISKLTVTSMVWNISTGQLGCLHGYGPFQLLHTCSLAESGKAVLDFLATTKNISVISILLILNLKHSSYWEKN